MSRKIIISKSLYGICLFFCFLFSLLGYIEFSNSDYHYISSIGKNWSTGPISEASLGLLDCPSGKVSIINDYWPGTSAGCYCKTGFLAEELLKGVCAKNSNCQTIFEIGKLPLKIWKGMNICAKRGPNYLDLKTAKSTSECGAGYKSCGLIDSLNNVLCYPDNIECPYNFIKVVPQNENVPTDKNFTVLNNNQETKLILSNQDINGKILNQFKIDDNTPCLNPDYKNLSIKPYLLENTSGKNTCLKKIGIEYADKSYNKIDTENYESLYSQNKITPILKSLPKFSTDYNYLNSKTNLFYKNYIGMENSCKDRLKGKIGSNKVIQDLIDIENIISANINIFIIGFILATVGLVVIIVFGIIMLTSEINIEVFKWYYVIVMILISIPILVVASITVATVNNTNNDLTIFNEPMCTDNNTSLAVTDFSRNFIAGKTYSFLFLVVSVVLMIVNITYFFS